MKSRHSVLLLTAAVIGCGVDDGPTIGISTSEPFLRAARMAVEDARLARGTLPDTVFITQAGNRAIEAIRAADSLVTHEDLIAVVGHSNSSASIAASQIYNQVDVVQVAPHSSATLYSRAGPYSFRLVPPDEGQGLFLAQVLEEVLPGGGEIALLYVNDDYGRGLRRALLDALDPERHPVVLEHPHAEDDVDEAEIEATVEAVGQAAPDAVVSLARGTVVARFLPGLREAAPGAVFLGSDAVAAGLPPVMGPEWEGVRVVDFLAMDATPALRDFARRYRERHGEPAKVPDALTYDATALLLSAIEAGARSGSELREYLNSLGRDRPAFEGLTGPITFDEDGDIRRPYVLRTLGSQEPGSGA